MELEGLTGKIKFDQRGLRTEFELQIVELKKHGLEKVELDIIMMRYNGCFRLAPGMITLV